MARPRTHPSPTFVVPMAAQAVTELPNGPDWFTLHANCYSLLAQV